MKQELRDLTSELEAFQDSMMKMTKHSGTFVKEFYNFSKLFSLWCNLAENFPIKPFRLATFVGLFLKLIIILLKKKSSFKKQYVIIDKTYK